jgi:hypothetical protein
MSVCQEVDVAITGTRLARERHGLFAGVRQRRIDDRPREGQQ